MRIGIDVDGVLACFFKAYEDLTVEVAGVDLFPARYPEVLPPTWNWPEHYGYSDEVMKEVWNRIKTSPSYWMNLTALPGARGLLKALNGSAHQIYFITDRPSVSSFSAQKQTADWLARHGFDYPAVIISGKHATKGDVCKGLMIEAYLDDKGENLVDVEEKSPNTRAYILDYPYNEEFDVSRRVYSLREFLEEEDLVPLGN